MTYIERAVKVLPNAFLFFVELGTVSENGGVSITVDENGKPDVSPVDNWPQRPCTLEFDVQHEYEDDKVKCSKPTGGWVTENDRILIGTKLVFKEKVFSENYERLMWALPDKVQTNVPQIPFSNTKPEIYGWIKIEQQNQSGGKQVVCDVYGKLTLVGGTKTDGKHPRPEYNFEVIPSSLNSWVTQV